MTQTIQIGAMRHLVTLRQAVHTVSARGGISTQWAIVVTFRAEVTPMSATEVERAGQPQGTRMVRVRSRYLTNALGSDPDPKYRLVYDGRAFEVVSIMDVGERSRFHEILGVELVTVQDDGVGVDVSLPCEGNYTPYFFLMGA
jgi:SPP1 family predicted phage head-tail adaptor